MNINGCAAKVRNNLCHDLPEGHHLQRSLPPFENNIFRDLNTEVEDTGASIPTGITGSVLAARSFGITM